MTVMLLKPHSFRKVTSTILLGCAPILVSCAMFFASASPIFATENSPCVVEHLVTVLNGISSSKGKLEIGSKVKVEPGNGMSAFDATFIGRSVSVSGDEYYAFFKSGSSSEIYVIPPSGSVQIKEWNGNTVSKDSIQTSPFTINQRGGTCAAFSVFNCFRQLQLIGKTGNGEIHHELVNESARTSFLVELINDLYIEARKGENLDKVFHTKASKYGFKVSTFTERTHAFQSTMMSELKKGWPILFRYDVGPEMVESPHQMIELTNEKTVYDPHLWLPRDMNQPINSGHVLLATGYFEHNGKQYVLVSDPNWAHPRLWDAELFFRAWSSNMMAWIIREKN